MRILFVIIWILLSVTLFGQQLKFNGELVDTIYIVAHKSVYQFDERGTTKGKAQFFSIVFNPSVNAYQINQYYQDKYLWFCKSDEVRLKTKNLLNRVEKKIDNRDIENLLCSLTESIDTNTLMKQIDTMTFLNYVTGKQIRRIAKKYKANWYFNWRYSSKEENEEFFDSCRSLDTLKEYLNDRFELQGYIVTSETSSTIEVWISTTHSEFYFEGKYPNPYKQPWYNHSKFSQGITPVLNFEINKFLIEILPKDFLLIESISNEALFDDYIAWYLERRGLKHHWQF